MKKLIFLILSLILILLLTSCGYYIEDPTVETPIEKIVSLSRIDGYYNSDDPHVFLYNTSIRDKNGNLLNDICLIRSRPYESIEITDIIRCKELDYTNGEQLTITHLYKPGKTNMADNFILAHRQYYISAYDITSFEITKTLIIDEAYFCVNPFHMANSCKISYYDENLKLGEEHDGSLPYDFNRYVVFYIKDLFQENIEDTLDLFQVFASRYVNFSSQFTYDNYIWYWDRVFVGENWFIEWGTGHYGGGRFFYLDESELGYPTYTYKYEIPESNGLD